LQQLLFLDFGVITGIKGLIKMTSESKKETDSTNEDKMAQVWRSYNEAQAAWKELYNLDEKQLDPNELNNM
jgi:hypothetical protein